MYDKSQLDEGDERPEDDENMAIEVPDVNSPGIPRQRSPRSSQGSRSFIAVEQKENGRSPWERTDMEVNIGIEEVGDPLCTVQGITDLSLVRVNSDSTW